MRTTSTAAWTAALAVMSMRGPFTTAEAAPAQHQPRAYIPKHLKRGFNHTEPAIDSTSTSSDPTSIDATSSELPVTQDLPPPAPITDELSSSRHSRRTRSSTKSAQPLDVESLIESLISAGRLPETTNSVVTTTLTLADNALLPATYTITYTETSSPAPLPPPPPRTTSTSGPPVPLLTSVSVPLGTAPDTRRPQPDIVKPTKSTKATKSKSTLLASSALSVLNSVLSPVQPTPDTRASTTLNTTTSSALADVSSSTPSPSSRPPPRPTAAAPGGLFSDLLNTTDSQSSSQPPRVPNVLGTGTGGIVPLNEPQPTAAPTTKPASVDSTPTTDTGNIIVGLSTVLSELPKALSSSSLDKSSDSKSTKTDLLSALGISGVPTGISLPAQSVVPTGAVPDPLRRPPPSGEAQSSSDPAVLGITDTLTQAAATVSSAVANLTDGVATETSKFTDGITGPLSPAVVVPTGAIGSASIARSSVAPTITQAPESVIPTPPVVVDTATDSVESIASEAPSDPTPVVPTTTDAVPTTTDAATTPTDAVPTPTDTVETTTSEGTTDVTSVPEVTSVPADAHTTFDTATDTSTPPTTPTTTAYTITGGGNTFTVPIPTSTPASAPPTVATGGTAPTTPVVAPTASTTYTENPTPTASTAYTENPSPTTTVSPSTDYNTTASNGGDTISTSVPLTGGTTLPVGASQTASTSYPASSTPKITTPAVGTTSTDDHDTKAPETIKPTGTDTNTAYTPPTSWKFAPTTTETSDGISTARAVTATAPTGIPTAIAQVVQPPDGIPVKPLNSTLIQLGFNYGLNYPFVVGEPDSASQIFEYLPDGIAHGLGIQRHEVVMNMLMPYDTSAQLNYITTLAQAYIPSEHVSTLEMSLHMPLSQIYSHPDSTVQTLMGMINPTIGILPGAQLDGASSSAWYNNPASTNAPSVEDAAPIGGDSGSSNHVKGSTVGIGLGAVGGAAVYAAAMVLVARRYRKKRQGHQRASSVHTSGEMSQRSAGMTGFFMTGANGRVSGTGSGGRGSRTSAGSSNGRSVREQGISAPLMAENSLGWN